MLLRNEIDRDLGEISREMRFAQEDETPVFTWRGVEVACIPSSVARGVELDTEGNALTIDLRLIVRRAVFLTADSTLVTVDSDLYTADNATPVPVAGRTLTFRGAEYRILSARESGPLSHFELTLAHSGSNQ